MHKLILILSVMAFALQSWAAELSLNQFLEQVKKQNTAYQAAEAQAGGAKGAGREADLIYSPKLFGEVRTGYDEKLSSQSSVTYDQAKTNLYSLGVSQQASWGLNTKLSYTMAKTELVGASTLNNESADGVAQLEVAMPLWGNGFGRTVRANESLLRYQAASTEYQGLSQSANLLTNAENAYWSLSAATEQLRIEQESLQAALSIQSYVKKKSGMDLGEPADVVQANALVESYTLQVQLAQNKLLTAQKKFNLYLNQEPQQSVPELEKLNYVNLEKIEVPKARPGDRFDVKANEAQLKISEANSIVAKERNKPNLDLYASYSAYGQASNVDQAFEESQKAERDGALVGLKFSVPLNFVALNDAKNGAELTRVAAEKKLNYARLEQESDWDQIVQSLSDAKNTLKLSTSIEKIQKTKLEMERSRLRQGRTTTQQVLLFEQDYNKAQSSRIQAATQILQIQSQAKLYQTNVEGGN